MYADRVESGTKRSIRDRLDGNLDDELGRRRPPVAKRQRQNDDKWKHDLYQDGGGAKVSKTKVGDTDLRLVIQKRGSQKASNGGKQPAGRDLREKISGTVTSQGAKQLAGRDLREKISGLATRPDAREPAGRDLREKISGITSQGGKEPAGRDLREKISGTVASQAGKDQTARDLREKISGTIQPQLKNTNLPKAKPAPEVAKSDKISIPSVKETVQDPKKPSASSSSRKKSLKKSDLSVDSLLKSLGLEKYSIQFQAEEIDMTALRHMTEEDLRSLGIPMGPRKKILLALDSKA